MLVNQNTRGKEMEYMKKTDTTKSYTLQIRCTKKERNLLDKCALKENMNRSEFLRKIIFQDTKNGIDNVWFTVMIQEILNDIQNHYGEIDKNIERKVEKLWKKLS